ELTILLVIGFSVIYAVTIRREEKTLRGKFGEAFAEYSSRTPRFIPKPSLFKDSEERAVKPKVFRRSLFDSMFFIWVIFLFMILELLKERGVIPQLFSFY
ncbi:MAG: isoprenylcysteine carboxylmethyltransferase family protein, partial [Deltaproteobacteria bacterium]|nr:isoprenylcysteine carboxylmethyltransferase family protein [Deltaproteobacteria bacterium]